MRQYSLLNNWAFNRLAVSLLLLVSFNSASSSAPAQTTATNKQVINKQVTIISVAKAQALTEQIAVTAQALSGHPFSGTVVIEQAGQPLASWVAGDGINANSSYVIASQSKQITAALVLAAVDKQLISLSAPINQYLGTKTSPQPYDEAITVHHLLSHTSGVTPTGQDNQFTPGSQFRYSKLGYELLAQILIKVENKPFELQVAEFARQSSLPQLYSDTGSLVAIKQQQANLAIGRHEAGNKLIPSDVHINQGLLAAGGLQASATTLSQFMHQLHDGQLLSAASYQAMVSPHTARPHRWGNTRYGYGLQIHQQDQLMEYSHGGYIAGYSSLTLYYPRQQLAVVLLENTSLTLGDIDRAFALHDHLREKTRQLLLDVEK
ncbi:beta-lactamase family protein [Shewanella sp. Scap07]|uniref:serine hydrolase domain-containing protein n=1 Tax=Shewanella sp. Scap07 TaxID=2589987 RepID=UPI0015BB8383|nr:serine hydrolase domain-containing protein [Shewanella sp. Scap07]QLE86497.1 beta-lactamase family protein [Shewanella sp. Scap07]